MNCTTRSLLILTLVSAACEHREPRATAQSTLDFALHSLADRQDPGVVWDLLPASYQDDVTRWLHAVAERLPAGAHDKALLILRKSGVLLKTKGEYLAEFAPLKMAATALGSGAGSDDLIALFTAIGNIQILLGKSEVSTHAGLRTLRPARFLHRTGSRIWLQAERVFRITGRDPGVVLRSITTKTVSADADRATVTVSYGDWTGDIRFVRVEGRWIPRRLVEGFAELRRRADEFLRTFRPGTEDTKAIERELDAVLTELESLSKVSGRGKFTQALQRSISKYGKRVRKLLGF